VTVLLTDNPLSRGEDDRFGFLAHARVLCDAIEATTDLPLTIGIFGPWGTGKSSFMNICRELLTARGLPAITFNPWKYDQRDEIWHALIQTVLTEISRRLAEDRPGRSAALARAGATVAQLSRTAAWLMARRAAGPLTGGLLSAGDLDSVREAWSARRAEQYRHVNRFEQDFREVVQVVTDGGRLVLFIDDLDRCAPAAAVTVLDALKLFLGEASCVFVLALDAHLMAEAAAGRYGGDLARGHQYLEKLINFPYHLPAVPFESIRHQLRGDLLALGEDSSLWAVVDAAFGPNLRRVRRFISAFNLTTATLRVRTEPVRDQLLHAALLLAVRLRHPDFFAGLQTDPELWSRVDQAARGDRSQARPADVALLDADPGLRDLLYRTSPRRPGSGFPPLPTADTIRELTGVVAVTAEPLPAVGADRPG
jgi:hypothetical protein